MYRLSIYSSRITFPLSFALHTWVVLESPDHGANRYEIHSFKNNQTEEEGMSIFCIPYVWSSKKRFKSKCHYQISGIEYKDLILNLEQRIKDYPYKNLYRPYPSPNSNSFTRWILGQNEITKNTPLPWNAFGRNFKI